MRDDLIAEIYVLRDALPVMTPEQREALSTVETFCAVALRIIAKTNPSKVRSEALTTEISTLIDGPKLRPPSQLTRGRAAAT